MPPGLQGQSFLNNPRPLELSVAAEMVAEERSKAQVNALPHCCVGHRLCAACSSAAVFQPPPASAAAGRTALCSASAI